MKLPFLIQRLLIIPCLLSIALFSQNSLSDNPTYRTKQDLLELAFKEGVFDLALKGGFLYNLLGLSEVPLKGESLDFTKLDPKQVNWRRIISLLAKNKGTTDLSNLDLSGLDLSGLDLVDYDVNFDGSNFKGTILDRARIRGSMKNVLMDKKTSLKITDLQGVNVRGADLRTNLDEVNFWTASFDDKTKFPANFITRQEMIKVSPHTGLITVKEGTRLVTKSSCRNFFSWLFQSFLTKSK